MTNLAIECSGTAGSVALFDGETPIAYADLDPNLGSVRTLAAAVEAILRGREVPNFISVTTGPGSFTGLRVGLATAKMLGLAWRIPIVPVDTLQAIALRAFEGVPSERAHEPFVAVINAFRGQVFASIIEFEASRELTVLAKSCVIDAAAWGANPLGNFGIDRLAISKTASAWITGPGLKSYPPAFEQAEFSVVEEGLWNPTATEVASLGRIGLAAGKGSDAYHLEPNYIRASAAEEKRQQTPG